MRCFRSLALFALAIALVGACSDDGGGPEEPTPPPTTGPDDPQGPNYATETVVGEVVVAWSEGVHEDLQRLAGVRMLADDTDRDAFVAEVGASPDTAPVEAVDMERHLLVVGSYHQCDEFAEVVTSADASRLWFQVVQPDPGVECVWAPLQIEVHQVDRDLVAGDVVLDEESVFVRRAE